MNKLKIDDFNKKNLQIIIIDKSFGAILKFIGFIDSPNSYSYLKPYFQEIHTSMIEQGLKKIIIDLNQLNYINSTGLASFSFWINELSNVEKNKQYYIKFLMNKKISWHKNLSTLASMLPELVEIIEEKRDD